MKKSRISSLFLVITILGINLSGCVNKMPITEIPLRLNPSATPDPSQEPVIQSRTDTEKEYPTLLSEFAGMPTAALETYSGESVALKEMPATAPGMNPSYQPTLVVPNGQPYWDNYFKNYGVNPFIDTEDDHFSTFALDVDTGSYSIARRYLKDGHVPEPDAVRVEEFVNSFDQGYPIPSAERTFSITLDAGPSPFTENDKYDLMRVGIQGYSIPDEERKDVALTFVIDVSGSMNLEDRLELVKKSLKILLDQLRDRDSVSIVVYGTEARVVLEPTSGDEKDTILDAIMSLHPEGATNAEGGLILGYMMAQESYKPKQINRVILCSDGVANVGNTGADEILEKIHRYAREGITLTTLGFGMGNYNDVLMEQLADKGDGFYAYIDTLSEAKRLFVDNLTSTLQVIAMNAKIQVDFNPRAVARYRLVGFENRAVADDDFRNDKVDAGEIGAGHAVTALYEIKFQSEYIGDVASVHLRWEDPQTHHVSELVQTMHRNDVSTTFEDTSLYFQWDAVVSEFAEIMRDSYWAKGSDMSMIYKEAKEISQKYPSDPTRHELVELVRLAMKIDAEEHFLSD